MEKLKVLIVDESAFFRRLFRRLILAIPGIRIIGEADDPLVALRFIRTTRPDAIIIDAKTERRFGIDVLRHLQGPAPIPKVIMLTGDVYFRYRRDASRKADFLLHKFTEYNRIPEILKRFTLGPAAGCESPGPGLYRA